MNGPRLGRSARRLVFGVAWVGAVALLAAPSRAQQILPPPGPPADGAEVLTQGPLHEAFAEPVVFDPRPGPVVPKEPPVAIQELPPDQKPEGQNVQWIPGYWAWDDTRTDFLWVSGLWRDIPPDRQWLPGYWAQAEGGFQWVPGAWTSVAAGPAAQISYLPAAPPESLEAGPNSPAPSPGATWSPGYWAWQDTGYAWRPGFWVPYQPNWAWVPAHYVWSPSGYLFVDGYWDYPIVSRGTCFAPVYYQQPVYRQAGYRYTPTIGLVASSLVTSLFVRPSYHQYYFGDYYAANNFQSGIYPWYSYHQSRYGYDPAFAQYAATNVRQNPNWVNDVHQEYQYRRDHPEARPPHTYVEQQRVFNQANVNSNNRVSNTNITNISNVQNRTVNITRNLVLAQPLHQIAAHPTAAGPGQAGFAATRFTKLDQGGREAAARQGGQLQQFRAERLRQEREVAQHAPANRPQGQPGHGPRQANLARSPVANIAAAGAGPGHGPGAPPARPNLPPIVRDAPHRPQGNPNPRPEPHPDAPPRVHIGQANPGPGHPQDHPGGPGRPNRPDMPKAQPRPEGPRPQPNRPEIPKAQPRPEGPRPNRPDMPKAQPRPEGPRPNRPDMPKAQPRPEGPRPQPNRPDMPKAQPRPEGPRPQPNRPEVPKAQPRPEGPRPQPNRPEAAKAQAPRPEGPRPQPNRPEAKKGQAPRPEVPKGQRRD